jgi:hypothetical protein
MNREAYVHALLCNYIRANYPDVIFTSDLSGIRLPMGLARKVKPLKSSRGIPDLIILWPANGFHGLLLEIKATDESVLRKDGQMRADPHLCEQIQIIRRLRQLHYAAFFVNGVQAGKKCIENYMRLARPQHGDALTSTPCEENHPLEFV